MDDIKRVKFVFNVFEDLTRLRICLFLAEKGQQNVTEICNFLEMNQSAISHHLQLLRLVRLVNLERRGKYHYYHLINCDSFSVAVRLLEQIEQAAKDGGRLTKSPSQVEPPLENHQSQLPKRVNSPRG